MSVSKGPEPTVAVVPLPESEMDALLLGRTAVRTFDQYMKNRVTHLVSVWLRNQFGGATNSDACTECYWLRRHAGLTRPPVTPPLLIVGPGAGGVSGSSGAPHYR
ncbi:Uncharacterized protein OBRU01_16719 [Operophtera brumata]|uniref:Uncharacterized protein n=1 Tax=Operophtera brumata TaxID=104452 RepID=A0A0L7KX41_OPEBR|nr:Uncharacterized protein OBRU01_16719 [Operophtera brumata]